MRKRDRFADWISGGLITAWYRDYCLALGKASSKRVALERIAAMETPNANATVRRMAKTAREALK